MAEDTGRSIAERIRFLAIVSDSLDDFFQARVAGLHVEAVVPVADPHQKQEIEQFLR
jgi:polyphosphate kinase